MLIVSKIPPGVGPRHPQVVILVGATGDLSCRKLLPGLFHLATGGFIPGCRIIGAARDAFATRKITEDNWNAFAQNLDYVPLSAGAEVLKAAVDQAERAFSGE